MIRLFIHYYSLPGKVVQLWKPSGGDWKYWVDGQLGSVLEIRESLGRPKNSGKLRKRPQNKSRVWKSSNPQPICHPPTVLVAHNRLHLYTPQPTRIPAISKSYPTWRLRMEFRRRPSSLGPNPYLDLAIFCPLHPVETSFANSNNGKYGWLLLGW
jgi:hypothetical protein